MKSKKFPKQNIIDKELGLFKKKYPTLSWINNIRVRFEAWRIGFLKFFKNN